MYLPMNIRTCLISSQVSTPPPPYERPPAYPDPKSPAKVSKKCKKRDKKTRKCIVMRDAEPEFEYLDERVAEPEYLEYFERDAEPAYFLEQRDAYPDAHYYYDDEL